MQVDDIRGMVYGLYVPLDYGFTACSIRDIQDW